MKALRNDEELTLFISREEIASKIKILGAKLSEEYKDKEATIIGVLNGSFVFMSDLIRELDLNLKIDFVGCKSYSGTQSTNNLTFTKQLNGEIKNKHVIVVEDVLDTGFTLTNLMAFFAEKHPASLKLVTLLDKKACHPEFKIAYESLFVIENVYVVGYGFDCDERFRQLPNIYIYQAKE